MSLENVKHILLVLSGKGGVGKSSITTQLALSLSLSGKRVGILDIDLTGPSIPRLLGLEDAKITQAPGGWNPVEVHAAQTLPPLSPSHVPPQLDASTTFNQQKRSLSFPASHANGTSSPTLSSPTTIGSLHATSLAFLLPSRSSAVIWRGPKKTAMVRQFLTDVLWPELDYLLIDTPPGTSDEHISLAETLLEKTSASNQLAGAVIVTTPQAVATADVRKEINFCKKTGIPIVGVVENMSGFVCECCGEMTNLFGKGGGEVMSREFGVRFLGGVPVDLGWGVVVEEGGWAVYGDVKKDEEQGNGALDEDGEGRGVVDGGREELVAEGVDGREDDGRSRRKADGALLVQRYRSCKLCDVFEGITEHVVDLVEGGQEVANGHGKS